jgi:hypothetical protein
MANTGVYEMSCLHNFDYKYFHQPSPNLSKYQTGVYYMGHKVFNFLLVYMKQESDNPQKFESVSKKFLYENSFYSLEEFYRLLRS